MKTGVLITVGYGTNTNKSTLYTDAEAADYLFQKLKKEHQGWARPEEAPEVHRNNANYTEINAGEARVKDTIYPMITKNPAGSRASGRPRKAQ